MKDDLYTEQNSYKEIPIIEDIKEAAGVMAIGFCFIVAFILIMTLLMSYERD